MPFFQVGHKVSLSIRQVDAVPLPNGVLLNVGTEGNGGGTSFGWQAYEVDGTKIDGFKSIGTPGIPGVPQWQDVAARPDGGFWMLASVGTGTPSGTVPDGIYTRVFDADLTPMGPFLRHRNDSDREAPAGIAVGPAGQALVTFSDNSRQGERGEIFRGADYGFNTGPLGWDAFQVSLNSDGSRFGGVSLAHKPNEAGSDGGTVNSRAADQFPGKPAILADGTTVVPYLDQKFALRNDRPWVTAENSISVAINNVERDVYAVVDGVPSPSYPSPSADLLPQAVALSGGGFVLAWSMRDFVEGQVKTGLYAQAFNAGGSPVGPLSLMSPLGFSVSGEMELVAMPSGGATILYNLQPVQGAAQTDVYATTISATGVKGDQHAVAVGPANAKLASAALASDSSLIVNYHEGVTRAFSKRLVFDDGQSSTFTGTKERDVYSGDAFKNWVDAEGGNDFVRLNAGNDRGHGGNGDDTVRGGDGHDLITGGRGRDNLLGERGFDTISGGGGDDIILGGSFSDVLDGGANNDMLRGQAGHDLIEGGRGNDTLIGAAGDDTLDGGAGFDLMNGGAGADTFVLRRGPVQSDEIRGFNPEEDRILIDGDSLDGIEVINSPVGSILLLGDGVEAVLTGVSVSLSDLDIQLI